VGPFWASPKDSQVFLKDLKEKEKSRVMSVLKVHRLPSVLGFFSPLSAV
jgi:hypothetical protein